MPKTGSQLVVFPNTGVENIEFVELVDQHSLYVSFASQGYQVCLQLYGQFSGQSGIHAA